MSYVPINSKALEGQARLTPYTGKPVEISLSSEYVCPVTATTL